MEIVVTEESIILQGKTYDHRETIKELGGRWNPERKVWILPLIKKEAAEKLVLYSRPVLPERKTTKHRCGLCGVEGHKRGTCSLPAFVKHNVQQDPKWQRFVHVNTHYREEAEKKEQENPHYFLTPYRLCFCTDHRVCLACRYGCCDQVYVGTGTYLSCKEHGDREIPAQYPAPTTEFERLYSDCEHKARKLNINRRYYVGD